MVILKVVDLVKRFGGITALNNVSFEVMEGERLGIIGPNGAGKTTLFNLISGFDKPDRGNIYYIGKRITGIKPYHAARNGIARTFQIVRPLKEMSVEENVILPAIAIGGKEVIQESRIDSILKSVGLFDKKHVKAGLLTHGELKKLELARALASRPRLLLLDEPYGGLTTNEISELSSAISEYEANGGTTIIIEHRLRELIRQVDRVLVLDQGRIIFEGRPQDAVNDSTVIKAYLGKAL